MESLSTHLMALAQYISETHETIIARFLTVFFSLICHIATTNGRLSKLKGKAEKLRLEETN